MKYTRKLFTVFFAIVLLIGSTAVFADAQRRGGRVVKRPVIVRHYHVRHDPFWRWNSWYNPYFGDPYFYDPYLRERRQRYYLENELRGNRKELRKHIEKFNADGVITAKEQRELEDDYRDVEKAERKLADFNDGD